MLLVTQIIFWLNNGNLKRERRGGIFTGKLAIRSLQERQLQKLGNATEEAK